MNVWLRALISSAIVAFLVAALIAFVLPRSTAYSPGLAWDEIKDLRYEEAITLINSRAHEVHGLAPIYGNLTDPWAWQIFGSAWGVLTVPCFLACGLLLLWQRRAPP